MELDKKVWNDLVAPNKTRLPKTIYKAVGCEECRHTGYYGRTGIYEALFIDNEFQHLINTSRDLTDYYAAAAKQGMRPLNISGAQKIAEGLTTLEEIYSVVPPVTGSIK
ncbi:MAG: hypothetical protein A3J35_01315 [Gammaproteobacteria bacterium RIFCSPLOWO2_02_FULL_52_10]|nr:MAG: hypothetical protein A3J35_01315 [Gammaproteobacteria bacterium RIFCSPLOWO2_02_FULL_52_10]